MKRVTVVVRDAAGSVVLDLCRHVAGTGDHGREAAGQGLEYDVRPALRLGQQHEQVGGAEPLAELGVGPRADEAHVVGQAEASHRRLELRGERVADAAAADQRVEEIGLVAEQRGQRLDHRVLALV